MKTDGFDRLAWEKQKAQAAGDSLIVACAELLEIAEAIETLPPRLRRKLQARYRISPELIRNEAERGRDTLFVYGFIKS